VGQNLRVSQLQCGISLASFYSAISTWFGEAPTNYGTFAFLVFEFQVLPVRISGSISS